MISNCYLHLHLNVTAEAEHSLMSIQNSYSDLPSHAFCTFFYLHIHLFLWI